MATAEEHIEKGPALKKKDEGNVAFKEHRYNKAIHLYTESLRLEPNHLVYGNRAQSYIHLKQYELALRDLNEALMINPSFTKNINRRAKVLSNMGMNSEARLDCDAVLRLAPMDENARAEASALIGKEDARVVCLHQWNKGVEFEDDDLIPITIDGLNTEKLMKEITVVKTPKKKATEIEKEVTVEEPPKPIVVPPPATNYCDYCTHAFHLKRDAVAFGKYFLSIPPSSHYSIFYNLLDNDQLRVIIEGLTEAANSDMANLSLISSSLLSVSLLPRFDILVLVMREEERAKVFSLIDRLPSTAESGKIRENFQ